MKYPGITAPHALQFRSYSAMGGIILQTMSSYAANCMMMIPLSHCSERRRMRSCWLLHGGHTGKGCSAMARKSKSQHAARLEGAGPGGSSLRIVGLEGSSSFGVITTSCGHAGRTGAQESSLSQLALNLALNQYLANLPCPASIDLRILFDRLSRQLLEMIVASIENLSDLWSAAISQVKWRNSTLRSLKRWRSSNTGMATRHSTRWQFHCAPLPLLSRLRPCWLPQRQLCRN